MLIYGNLNLNNGSVLNGKINPVVSASEEIASYASTQDISGMIFYDLTNECFSEAYLDEEENEWKLKALSNPDSKEAGSTVGHVLTAFTNGANGAKATLTGAAVGTLNTENERGSILTGKTSINAEFKALEDAVLAIDEPEYTMVKAATPTSGYFATYQLCTVEGSLNTPVGDAINIPKDFLVKSAEVKTCTEAGVPLSELVVGDKYIDFTVNAKSGETEAEATHLYLAVKALVSAYSAGDGIAISDANAISVKLKEVSGTKYNVLTESSDGLFAAYADETMGANGVITADDHLKIFNTQTYKNVTGWTASALGGYEVFIPIFGVGTEETRYYWSSVTATCYFAYQSSYEMAIPSNVQPSADESGNKGVLIVCEGMTTPPTNSYISVTGSLIYTG